MKDHLSYKDLDEPISNKNLPEGENENEWKLLNCKAVVIILKYIDRSLFEHVSNFYKLWRTLQ